MEYIKISANYSPGQYERKHYKPRFVEECSKFVHQRKQAKVKWLQDPGLINADDLNKDVQTSRHFRWGGGGGEGVLGRQNQWVGDCAKKD